MRTDSNMRKLILQVEIKYAMIMSCYSMKKLIYRQNHKV